MSEIATPEIVQVKVPLLRVGLSHSGRVDLKLTDDRRKATFRAWQMALEFEGEEVDGRPVQSSPDVFRWLLDQL